MWIALARIFREDVFRLLAVWMLRGVTIESITRESARFVHFFLTTRRNESVASIMQYLREQGYTIVLASSSLSFVVKEIASLLGINAYFACVLESDHEVLTGRYAQDIRGHKHLVLAKHFPNCTDLVVVTDNYEDADLIKTASRSWIICRRERRKRWVGVAPQSTIFVEDP